MCFTLSQWAALIIHFYTSKHSHASITLAATLYSYFHQKHVNAPKSAFTTLVFLRHSRLEGRFVIQWCHHSLPWETLRWQFASWHRWFIPPSRHWSTRIVNPEFAADWSVGVRRCELRGAFCFWGFWTSVTSYHASLWWCCPHITPQHRPESCWTLPSWVFRSQCTRVYRSAI